jgi:homoisocitrate dehydrogenase
MKLCVIPGDGIGSEVVDAARRVLEVLAPEIELIDAQAGWGTFLQVGTSLPDETLRIATASDAVFFGAVASPSHPVSGYSSPIIGLRRALDLYANIRPVNSQLIVHRHPLAETDAVDMVVVRENTEGLYVGRERMEDEGNTAIAERVISRKGSERILRQAFELARERVRNREQEAGHVPRLPKVTVVHKANVLRLTDGLFREIALEMGRQYPEIAVEELLVDTAAMHVAQTPRRFDVIVTTNLYGDILSDIACIHAGGLGMASSANLGNKQALFEPVHGAAPDIAGRGIANPLAAFGCVAMLLEWAARQGLIQRRRTDVRRSSILRMAMATVQRQGMRTPDLGGNATTEEVTAAVLEQVHAWLADE